jgi:hypothetical protein
MKRVTGLGLIGLILMLVTAGCGSSVSDEGASQSESAAGPTQATAIAEKEVIPEVEPTKEESNADAVEVAEAEASVAEEAAVSETPENSSDCGNPFAGVSQVRFNPEIWTADQIARFAGPTKVDPNGGAATDFCQHSVDYSEILSGGPPPDGIPPLDDPAFDSLESGDAWLAAVQPVLALEINGDARAYPLAILTRHEIVNDEVGGVPVAATFCPLCNAGIVFKREVDGEVLRFGVSGNLRNSDLIMWDNKTLSWWQQFTGEAIVGSKTGTQLEFVPAQLVAWKDFKERYPEGQVLSTNGQNYGQNPYTGYDSSTRPFLYTETPDPRLPATARVLGHAEEGQAIAYPLTAIAEAGVIEDTIGGREVVIFYEPGQVSALDKSVIEDSKEVGSAAMFIPVANGQKLTFTYQAGVIRDNETGSEWDVFGQAIAGELAGTQLEPVLSFVHFWFAWAAFQAETGIYGRIED